MGWLAGWHMGPDFEGYKAQLSLQIRKIDRQVT